MGNGINWKGQVFPRMRNFTASNRMTGVGNALKRLYQRYLAEYEQARVLFQPVLGKLSSEPSLQEARVSGLSKQA